MGNANVAFTDLGGPTGTRFPKVSEFEDQQQYPASQTRPGQSFENIVGECSLLERMPEQAVIAATYDSFVRHQGEPTIASAILRLRTSVALLDCWRAGQE